MQRLKEIASKLAYLRFEVQVMQVVKDVYQKEYNTFSTIMKEAKANLDLFIKVGNTLGS